MNTKIDDACDDWSKNFNSKRHIMQMTSTDWLILERLYDGTLTWGAAVGACWPLLAHKGYVERDFGNILPLGRQAVEARRAGNS